MMLEELDLKRTSTKIFGKNNSKTLIKNVTKGQGVQLNDFQ